MNKENKRKKDEDKLLFLLGVEMMTHWGMKEGFKEYQHLKEIQKLRQKSAKK